MRNASPTRRDSTAASTPAHPGTVADPQLGCAVAKGAPVTHAAPLLVLTTLFLCARRKRRAARDPRGANSTGMRRRGLCGVVGGVAGAASLLGCVKQAPPPQRAQQAQAVAAPHARQPPEPLPPAVQDLLRRRMVSHAHDMNELVSAIMLLDYPVILDRAERIASDARVKGDASIPERFLIHEERVRFEARRLVEAARAGDADQIAVSYGQVAESCVRCHADYRARD